ncbi:hypothetical protein G6F56_002712 [Rhizopus delemar]|uniref:NodB homology domain-containing protein n=1 Tax=Rhizopus stolonifer TaxID=4846 RepID=A0A367KTW5_RHIST|nr:hypothetical protein G6F56_002712 [Rhizopus delemar]RCI05626.1 hypothetical protein CU098_002313 [Rhizopus stolonifer]
MYISKSIVLFSVFAQVYAATSSSSSYLPQVSPVFPSNIPVPSGAATSYNSGPYETSSTLETTALTGFPTTWKIPSTTSTEVKNVYNSIDWTKVPNAPVRKIKSDGSFSPSTDGSKDPYCYWSDTNCVQPKVSYLPPDLYECPTKGYWGLTYDDGPFNRVSTAEDYASAENRYAEPALYNYLAENNLHASLFYIGSNVVGYPAAARLALNNGNSLCVHTWSHNPMTTLTNAEIVAELYWSIKAIKTATGITPKCWRPPQGDVDDRVRSIAWQMGLRNVLWNEDTNDWDMPDTMNGGNLPSKTVDGYFQSWINAQKAGKLKTGILVLEHELNRMTVNMSMHWLPIIQKDFNVVSALSCNGISQPYWETDFVYPVVGDNTTKAGTTTTTTTKAGTATTTTKAAATTTTAISGCVSGSYGLGNGDGYNGYCCKSQADCLDDCISGKCNGAKNIKATTTKIVTKPSTKSTTTKKATTTTKKATIITKKSSKKSTTKKLTTKKITSATCKTGSTGKKQGSGKTGACCSSSNDCEETCRSGVCGV